MLARSLYSLLLYLCLPLVLGYFAWRSLREPDYRKHWAERLGFGVVEARRGIWLHAASVGEVQAAVPLVQSLARRYPDHALLVTVFTPTGRARAQAAFEALAQVRYLPFDLPGGVGRFLRAAQPRAGLIVETEIWPNLLAGCRRRNVPVMFVNGRLSERSARRYARQPLRALMAAALVGVARVAAAGPEDARRFIELGVPAATVTETGNLKFDLQLPDQWQADGLALRQAWGAMQRPVWVAASTHADEEQIVLDAFAQVRATHPSLLLVLVPRHPQRFDGIADLLTRRGFVYARHSEQPDIAADCAVLLGDTLGELLNFYAASDLAFVGGSLAADVGGHNLLEPAALQLPILVGPHLEGWKTVADWLDQAGALWRVTGPVALAAAVTQCLDDDAGRRRAGRAAQSVVHTHSGALQRTLTLVQELLVVAEQR